MGRWSVLQESTSQSPPDIPHSSSPQAFPTSYQKTKSLVIMKILLHYQRFRFIWLAKPAGRHFHKHPQLQTPLTLADFEAINRCEKPLPKNFNFAADVLDQWSQKEKSGERPANPALWWVNGKGDEVKWSFQELGSLSRKAANVLTKPCGLQRGDRVAVILPRIPEWWLINVACIRTGLVFMPGTTQLTRKDILYRLQASKAKCIVASEEVAPAVDSIVSECPNLKTKLLVSPDRWDGWLNFQELLPLASEEHSCVETGSQEPMAIYFTSGTTGSPKMAQHSQSSLGIGYALCGRYWLDLTPSDIMWNMSDTGWIKAAIGSVFSTWLQGACVFVHRMAQFDTDTFLDTLTTYPITTLCSAPTVYRMLVQKDLKRYRIGPFEVESALIEHPAVVESAVVSSPDPIRGEVEFVQELPKTITGKIKRNVLRDQEWGRA
ncbi:acyl-CoA synthetase medium-chain family member 4 [Cricetulus griseus]